MFVVDGVIHYCVANMPGGVPVTSTKALTNATLPYVEAIADHGLRGAVAADPALAKGVNVLGGKITYEAVAEAHGLDVHAARRRAARRCGRLGRGLGGSAASLRPGVGLILTTSHVTPAASAITQAMNTASPTSPSAVATGLG